MSDTDIKPVRGWLARAVRTAQSRIATGSDAELALLVLAEELERLFAERGLDVRAESKDDVGRGEDGG